MTTASIYSPTQIRRRKLLPPRLEGQLVARPRLMARLDESLRLPLTLIVAPAGFGKTTLVAQWLAGIATPATWLTVDAGDEDATHFVTHLVAVFAADATALVGNKFGAPIGPDLKIEGNPFNGTIQGVQIDLKLDDADHEVSDAERWRVAMAIQ